MKKFDKNTSPHLPPHSIEAEQSTLGSMILDNATIVEAIELLKKEDFYSTAHQIIFETIISLFDRNIAVDLTTLIEELKKQNELDAVGGPSYVASLEQYVITTENVSHHIKIVKDKSKLRSLIDSANQIMEMAYEEQDDVNVVLDNAEKIIFEISQDRTKKDFQEVSEITVEVLQEIEQRYKTKKDVTGLPTGFTKLDLLTSGFQKSELIILAARPSMGKTALALNIASYVTVEQNLPVGFFSLEMSSNQIDTRLLCSLSMIASDRIRSGYISGDELHHINRWGKQLSDAPLFIDDSPALSILELRSKARRLKAQKSDLALIVIDYIQLVKGTGKKEQNRQQEVAEISRSLKALAKELNIPIVALSQLSRLIEQRKGRDKRPILSDLRESGAIEQDADIVLFIHRESLSQPQKGEEGTPPQYQFKKSRGEECELIIAKQRNGPLDTVRIVFFPDCTAFREPAKWKEKE